MEIISQVKFCLQTCQVLRERKRGSEREVWRVCSSLRHYRENGRSYISDARAVAEVLGKCDSSSLPTASLKLPDT